MYRLLWVHSATQLFRVELSRVQSRIKFTNGVRSVIIKLPTCRHRPPRRRPCVAFLTHYYRTDIRSSHPVTARPRSERSSVSAWGGRGWGEGLRLCRTPTVPTDGFTTLGRPERTGVTEVRRGSWEVFGGSTPTFPNTHYTRPLFESRSYPRHRNRSLSRSKPINFRSFS